MISNQNKSKQARKFTLNKPNYEIISKNYYYKKGSRINDYF